MDTKHFLKDYTRPPGLSCSTPRTHLAHQSCSVYSMLQEQGALLQPNTRVCPSHRPRFGLTQTGLGVSTSCIVYYSVPGYDTAKAPIPSVKLLQPFVGAIVDSSACSQIPLLTSEPPDSQNAEIDSGVGILDSSVTHLDLCH